MYPTRIVPWLLLSACMPNFTAPKDFQLTCARNEDCPPTTTCSTLLQRCVVAGDAVSPTIVSVTLTPPFVAAAGRVSLAFKVDAPLGTPPTVRTDRGETAVLEEATRDSFRYTFTVSPTTQEGPLTFLVDLIDASGNLTPTALQEQVVVDKTPPTVASLQLGTAKILDANTRASIALAVSEPLAEPPLVTLSDGSVLTVEATQEGYVATTATTPTEGVLDATVRLVDPAGNVSEKTFFALLEFDFAAPSLLEPAQVESSVVRQGQSAVVAFALNEALGADPSVIMTNGSTTVAMNRSSLTGNRYTFSYQFGTEPDATYSIKLARAADVAGNAITDVSLGSVIFDKRAPVLSAPVVTPAHASEVIGHNTITLDFDSDEDVASTAAVNVSLGNNPFENCQLTTPRHVRCTHSVDKTGVAHAADVEGVNVISIVLRDAAGNSAFAAASVDIDYTPPIVVSSSVTPLRAKLGDTAIFTLLANEELAAPPTLQLTQLGAPAFSYVASTRYFYSHLVQASDTDGAFTPSVVLTDLAGNASASLPVAQVRIDAHPPLLSHFTLSTTLLSRQPGHNTVDMTFDASENLDAPASVSVSVGDQGHTATCDAFSVSSPNYHCVFAISPTGALPPAWPDGGTQGVSIFASDAAGNTGLATRIVTFDYAPPALLGSARLTRNDNYAAASVSQTELFLNRARVDVPATPTSLLVDFSVSEALDEAPVLTPGASSVTGVGLAWHAEIAPTGPDGDYSLVTDLKDKAGNIASGVVLGLIHLDTTPPIPPFVTASFLHERFPWGDATSANPRQTLQTSGTVEPYATLSVYTSDDPNIAQLIGTVAAGPSGGVAPIAVTPVDQVGIYLTLRDRAGNAHSSVPWLVDKNSWTARMSGHSTPQKNPHLLRSTSALEDFRTGTYTFESDNSAYALYGTNDGLFDEIHAYENNAWALLGFDTAPPSRVSPAIAFDPITKTILMHGGHQNIPGPNGVPLLTDTWRFDGRSWKDVSVGSNPPARIHGSWAAIDATVPYRRALLYWGGCIPSTNPLIACDLDAMDVLWAYRNGVFREQQMDIGQPHPPPGRTKPIMLSDPARHRVLVLGGLCLASGGICGDLWEIKENPIGSEFSPTYDTYLWNVLVPKTSPITEPLDSEFLSATIDTHRDVLVLQRTGPLFLDEFGQQRTSTEVWEASLTAEPLAFTRVCSPECPRSEFGSFQGEWRVVYDPGRQQTLAVGALVRNNSNSTTYLRETFAWTGSAWVDLNCASNFSPECIDNPGNVNFPVPPTLSVDLYGDNPNPFYDMARQQVFLSLGLFESTTTSDVLKYSNMAIPSVTAEIDVSRAGIETIQIRGARLDATSGGYGADATATPVEGSALDVWTPANTWQSLASVTGSGFLDVNASATDAAEAQSWVDGTNKLTFRVHSLAPRSSYPGNGAAFLQVESLGATLFYTLP